MKLFRYIALPAVLLAVLAGCSQEPADPGIAVFTPLEYSGVPDAGDFDAATQYRNPIIPGFYPDPSICRAGDDYYLVNSTFGYYPGIPVWHSTDLVHWEQVGNALTRNSQMQIANMGIVSGVFAPQISYNPAEKLFYIINTIVGGNMNFIVTSEDPKSGVWSEPTYLPQVAGIDPSLLFDEDGRAWIVSATSLSSVRGQRAAYEGDNGIVLNEFDWQHKGIVGGVKLIMKHGVHPEEQPRYLEGPHLYHVNGKYYLMCAEGGTEQGHSEVVFESDKVTGPYTPCKINPILTQRDLPLEGDHYVTCTGHADIVQSAAGQWYAVFLGVLPYEGEYCFNTGRQTFLLPFEWVDDQPVILPQGERVKLVVDMTDDMKDLASRNTIEGFDGYNPGPLWDADGIKDFVLFIRRPVANNTDKGPAQEEDFNFLESRKEGPFYSIDEKGKLSLRLKTVHPGSLGNVAFVGERVTAKTFQFDTRMDFTPTLIDSTDATLAGLLLYQNQKHYMVFVKTLDVEGKPILVTDQIRGGVSVATYSVEVPEGKSLRLRVEAVTPTEYVFSYSTNGKEYIQVGEPLDGHGLSTLEAGEFQGVSVGVFGYNGKASEFNPDNY